MAHEAQHFTTVSASELMHAAETAARSGKRQVVRVEGTPLSISPLHRADTEAQEPTPRPAKTRRTTGRLTPDDALFQLIGIGDSGIEGGISGHKHEALGKLRHT
jgi:hypothetical protein